MADKYLFIFTIGPVKDFINQSRKTQDLFAGSRILSFLTTEAMNLAIDLFNQSDKIIITPSTETKYKPNRFVALIEKKPKLDLHAIGRSIEESIKAKFIEIASIQFNGSFKKPVGYDEQLEDYLEIFWLFYPINGDYRTAYRLAFQELAAIKNITRYKEFEETGRKCSVNGIYNVKVYRKNKDGKAINLFQENDNARILEFDDYKELKIWHLAEGEGLSAVSLAKRIFNDINQKKLSEPHIFKSTARISLSHILENSKIKKLPEFIKYKEMCEEGLYLEHSDDQLLYKENIKLFFRKSENAAKLIDEFEDAHDAWTFRMNEDKIDADFTKYYALIRFDGDNMGDWLNGENLKDGCDLKDFHIALTQCIKNYTDSLDKLITKADGKIVYAGGEDFMAMINIHSLFKVLNLIKDNYKAHISDGLIDFKQNENDEMTISIGVAIGHYKHPLAMVLDKAKEMEKKAKDNQRNSYAIGVMKHGKNKLDTVWNWKKNNVNSFKSIENINKLVSDTEISLVFLRKIYGFFEDFGFDIKNNKDLIENKIDMYVNQLDSINEADRKGLKKNLKELLGISEIQNFADLLLVMDFLNRKVTSDDTKA
ncbi:MAG: type III-B CRISPR-associated protein Cas10/Cmr2 [Deltaproteobacteria bacterium]